LVHGRHESAQKQEWNHEDPSSNPEEAGDEPDPKRSGEQLNELQFSPFSDKLYAYSRENSLVWKNGA